MCLNPRSVPNPLFKRRGYVSQFGQVFELSSDFSPQAEFIEVPCGKCPECRDSYFNSLLQRAICESRSSYMYFVTLTYDDQHIPFVDLDDERILYADYSHIQDMIKRFRASCVLHRDFRYLCVNEYGDQYSRPHFHLIFFVAKCLGDTSLTPFEIERVLYDNLKVYFAENIGTRKFPKYVPLFTFAQRVTPKGIMSNYWVKYVEPDCDFDYLMNEHESSFIRTIRYLLGYVNTTYRIDGFVSSWLTRHSYDPILCDRVKRILANRVRFSKGFGCGFVDGRKFYLPKISCRASSNILIFSELCDNLPNSGDDFELYYPELFEQVVDWIAKDVYSKYDSLEECMKHFTVDDYRLHCLTLKYFPKHFASHYRNLYRHDFSPTLSYLFQFQRGSDYSVKKVKTRDVEDSDLYRYLRSGVEDGLKHRVPFIAFPIKSQQGYCAMCKYYRDRVTTFDDLRTMYDSIGVSNYDEWKETFIRSMNSRKVDKALGNEQKYKENCDLILEKQKKSLHLLRRKSPDLLFSLFVL